MTAEPTPRYGLVLSALGAILLAVAVFLPWYSLSFTPTGIAYAQQISGQLASEFGNEALQRDMSTADANLGGLAGHQFMALSAHQVLHDLNVVLLIVAGLAILITLLGLAGAGPSSSEGARGSLALLGALAAVCVLFRIVDRPSVADDLLAVSLREGAWLALLGALAIVAGALWPRRRVAAGPGRERATQDAFASLSGWTPQS